MTTTENKVILYADDDADDKAWVQDACQAINSSLKVNFVENGKDVLLYLSNLSPEHYPSLIVLDLNMPELDGKQTLQRLKKSESYQHIPVAIVTTSSNKIDREVCQRFGASVYLTKPDSYREWQNIISELQRYM